jgi:hypothetical protein
MLYGETSSELVSHEGTWCAGKPHGAGKARQRDGGVLSGTWDNGQLSGATGVTFQHLPSPAVYRGPWPVSDAALRGTLALANLLPASVGVDAVVDLSVMVEPRNECFSGRTLHFSVESAVG